ncbi:MAG: hypothetical protein AUK16_02870 [Parcubacteria group bacterium CG2_30_44_11]|nr:MAG: hypothetical protein AUK16_02870 [Parcubacteria group bacterium CG2_30_44_11]
MRHLRYVLVNFLHQVQVLWWFFRQPHTRGVKCLIFCGDTFLLVRPSYAHRRFTIPGGGVKRYESPFEAAYRKLFEETGVRIDQLTWFGQYTQKIEYKYDTVECYYGSVTTREVHPDNFEIVEATWFYRLDIPTDCSPSVHKIFTLYDSRE